MVRIENNRPTEKVWETRPMGKQNKISNKKMTEILKNRKKTSQTAQKLAENRKQ